MFFIRSNTEVSEKIRTLGVLVVFVVGAVRGSDMCTQTKAAAVMANIPQVDIDPSGVFKYVLIRVHSREEGDDSEVDIVRGHGWAEYHGEDEPEIELYVKVICLLEFVLI